MTRSSGFSLEVQSPAAEQPLSEEAALAIRSATPVYIALWTRRFRMLDLSDATDAVLLLAPEKEASRTNTACLTWSSCASFAHDSTSSTPSPTFGLTPPSTGFLNASSGATYPSADAADCAELCFGYGDVETYGDGFVDGAGGSEGRSDKTGSGEGCGGGMSDRGGCGGGGGGGNGGANGGGDGNGSPTLLTTASSAGLSTAPPVRVRGRPHLTFSSRPELPVCINAPATSEFPFIAVASHPEGLAASLQQYARETRVLLDSELTRRGAVLLRGVPLRSADDFARFVAALGWKEVVLTGGGTFRTDVAPHGVRTASDEPPHQTIEPHMDMAHSASHPLRIAFFSLAGSLPSGAGGETVLTDMRAVTQTLRAQGVAQEFERRGGVAYHKRLWSGSHRPNHYTWQQFFRTECLQEAVASIRELDPAATVSHDEVIDFRETRAATAPHPDTREELWFNGAHTNHRSYYEEAEHVDTRDGPPMNTTYADGTAIGDDTLAAIRGAMWSHSVACPLQTGDVVFVDNMLAGHGRMGWDATCPRKVLLVHFGA